ncbi:MAG TPA: MFS transporter [Anaeromyxobacteraceae bacterium]|nr:MFS transporter [Anaeromyxobacteraceae bacterium]
MNRARRDWRTPAAVLAAGAAVLAVAMGIRHSFGLFLAPMTRESGWTREVFAFAIALQNLVWGSVQPFAGRLADRFGAGKVILGGGLVYVAGLALMAQARTGTAFALAAGLLVGIGLSGPSFAVVLGAVARAARPEKRSLAMGIAMAVGSLGQFAMLPGVLSAIDAIGSTATLLALAALAATILPLSAPLFEKGEKGPAPTPLRVVLSEAFTHRGFWLLSLGFFVCGFHVVFIATHVPAYLADKGLAPRTGATVLALVGLFNIFGSYISGYLGGHLSKPGILVGIYALRAVVLAAFFLSPVTEMRAYAFGAAMGLLWLSTVAPTNGTVAAVFGVSNMAMLGGIVFFFHQVGGFLGGWLGGRLFVARGNYDMAWVLSIGLAILAALLNIPVRETGAARPLAMREGEA